MTVSKTMECPINGIASPATKAGGGLAMTAFSYRPLCGTDASASVLAMTDNSKLDFRKYETA